MKVPVSWILVTVAAAVAGTGFGWTLRGPEDSPGAASREGDGERFREERDLALANVEMLERELAGRRRRPQDAAVASLPRGVVPADSREPVPSAAVDLDPATEGEESGKEGLSPEQRLGRVAELLAAADGWFESGDGEAALSALTELASLAPQGRQAAMELAIRMNQDVMGAGVLKMSQMTFYTRLGDSAVSGLMTWSLENGGESPKDFRTMAAYSLPWILSPDETLERFSTALRTETELGVQEALVNNLSRMRKPAAEEILADMFKDAGSDPSLRVRIATELALSEQPSVLRAIEDAALGDTDPRVREAAKAALVMRDPPVTGYLVTGTVPESQASAAGLRAGDIVISYDGRSVRTQRSLATATREIEGGEPVSMVVIRDGGEVSILVRPGRLGVYGRGVEAKEPK